MGGHERRTLLFCACGLQLERSPALCAASLSSALRYRGRLDCVRRFGSCSLLQAALWKSAAFVGKGNDRHRECGAVFRDDAWPISPYFYTLLKFAAHEKWRRARDWSLFSFFSLVSGGFLSQLLKHIFGRKRPYADASLSSHEFSPFTINYEFHSLPSGHSQVLFSLASILSIIWPRFWWLWLSGAATFATTRVITFKPLGKRHRRWSGGRNVGYSDNF